MENFMLTKKLIPALILGFYALTATPVFADDGMTWWTNIENVKMMKTNMKMMHDAMEMMKKAEAAKDNGPGLKATWAHRLGDNPNPTATGNDQDGSLLKNRFWLVATLAF
jgi:hypothetical protein